MQRVFLTGVGLATSLGAGPAGVADAVLAERTAFVFDPALAGKGEERGPIVCPVPGDGGEGDRAAAALHRWRHRRYLDRGARLAVLAGLRAVLDAEIPLRGDALTLAPDWEDTSLLGCAAPGLAFDREPGLATGNVLDLDALWLLRFLSDTPLSALSVLLGTHGQTHGTAAACASALTALGEAFARVRSGACRRVLVACGDSRLSRTALLGYDRAHVLAKIPSSAVDPSSLARPFDAASTGFVPGEGGAAFMVESGESVRARNAVPRAELLGFGATSDAHGLTAPDPGGSWAARAVTTALENAGLTADEVDCVSAHGTGTPLNDAAEAGVLRAVFGDRVPTVLALKSWIGHCSAACGAVELGVLLSCLERGFVPRVRNLERPVADLPFARATGPLESRRDRGKTREKEGTVALMQNFGFGGRNAALVVRIPSMDAARAGNLGGHAS